MAKSVDGVSRAGWVESEVTCAEIQANYPTAGEIHSLLGSPKPVNFHRPSASIRVDRPRAAVSFFDE
jgi:hypothetical protein